MNFQRPGVRVVRSCFKSLTVKLVSSCSNSCLRMLEYNCGCSVTLQLISISSSSGKLNLFATPLFTSSIQIGFIVYSSRYTSVYHFVLLVYRLRNAHTRLHSPEFLYYIFYISCFYKYSFLVFY